MERGSAVSSSCSHDLLFVGLSFTRELDHKWTWLPQTAALFPGRAKRRTNPLITQSWLTFPPRGKLCSSYFSLLSPYFRFALVFHLRWKGDCELQLLLSFNLGPYRRFSNGLPTADTNESTSWKCSDLMRCQYLWFETRSTFHLYSIKLMIVVFFSPSELLKLQMTSLVAMMVPLTEHNSSFCQLSVVMIWRVQSVNDHKHVWNRVNYW